MTIRNTPAQYPVSPDHPAIAFQSVSTNHQEMIANGIKLVEIPFTRPIFSRGSGLHFLIENTIAERLRGVDFFMCCRQADGQIAGLDRFEHLAKYRLAIQFAERPISVLPPYVGRDLLFATNITKRAFSGRHT
jgi:hypothetical protein